MGDSGGVCFMFSVHMEHAGLLELGRVELLELSEM